MHSINVGNYLNVLPILLFQSHPCAAVQCLTLRCSVNYSESRFLTENLILYTCVIYTVYKNSIVAILQR